MVMMTMKKRNWLIGTGLVAAVLGGSLFWISSQYQPILWTVDEQVVRTDDWEQLKPIVFHGIPEYSKNDELDKLEQRSKEELILAVARAQDVKADQAAVEKQIEQIAPTAEERVQKFKEMDTTEEAVRTNYTRALTAFALKTKIAGHIQATEDEIKAHYEENKNTIYLAPEFRTVHFLRVRKDDTMLVNNIPNMDIEEFKNLVKKNSEDDRNARFGAFHELVGREHLNSHTGSEQVTEVAFNAQLNKITEPVEFNGFLFFFLVDVIKPPYQFTFEESRGKIEYSVRQEKQLKFYRSWLAEQEPVHGYQYFPENLDRGRLEAFWQDLPVNIDLLFGK